MSRQTVTTTTTRKRQLKKPKGTHPCPSCGGRGWKYDTGRGSKRKK